MVLDKIRKEKSTLSVEIDGKIVNKGNAKSTFIYVINHISNLVGKDILYNDFPQIFNNEVFINSKDNSNYNSGKDDSNNYFIMTHTTTNDKKNTLERISKKYNIDMKVDIIGLSETITHNQSKKVWLFSPGENANMFEEFYSEGIIALGWDKLGDLSQYNSPSEIVDKLKSDDSNPTNTAGMNYSFSKNMSIGDIVIAKRGRTEFIGYGEVTSDYYFNDERIKYKSCHDVKWIEKGSWVNDSMVSMKTLTEVTQNTDKFLNLIGYNQKKSSVSFYYNNELIKIEESNNRRLHNKIINWLFLNGYKFDNDYHNVQWRKIYNEFDKNELIENVVSYNNESFYQIEPNRYILKNSSLDFVKKMLEIHGCTFSNVEVPIIDISKIEELCNATLEIKRFMIDDEYLCNRLNSNELEYREHLRSYYNSTNSGVVIDIRKKIAAEVLLSTIDTSKLNSIISTSREKNPQQLKSWINSYNILYPFVNFSYKSLDKFISEDFVKCIISKLGDVKFKISNFNGSRNQGSTEYWIAFYNKNHNNQSDGLQLFISFVDGQMRYGIYRHIDRVHISQNIFDGDINSFFNFINDNSELILNDTKKSMEFIVDDIKEILQNNNNLPLTIKEINDKLNAKVSNNIITEILKSDEFENDGLKYKIRNYMSTKLKDLFEKNGFITIDVLRQILEKNGLTI